MRCRSRVEADARFLINDAEGCTASVDIEGFAVSSTGSGDEAAVSLAFVRDEIDEPLADYPTEGIMARARYDHDSSQLTLTLYAKTNAISGVLGTNLYAASVVQVAFNPGTFCNWLHNGQGDGDTEFGSYDLSLGLFADRQEGATWVIPSEDEWYKAAYYDPVNDCYYDYPNGTDDIPAEPTDGTSTRVFNFGDDPYWAPDGPWDYFTNIGETTGHSPYGAYDMGGNVEEWTDTMDVPYYQYRVTRGGHFTASEQQLRSSDYSPYGPDMDGARFGFRIAYIIPEPASCLLMLLGGLLFRKCRGRKSCWMSVC